MKKALHLVLVLVLALGLVITLAGCGVLGIGGQTAMTTAGPGRIDVDNIPDGGVTGGTDHGFCDPGEPDEWHFVINDLDPKEAAPAYMTAVFAVEGEVGIPLEKVTPGRLAHYTRAGYLDATLVGGYAYLEQQVTYNRFNLSHAPCGEAPPVAYNLTVSSTDGGLVTSPGEGSFTYDAGTVVDLVATPDAGYRFSHWSGDLTGTDNPETITMDGNKSVTATFTRDTYTLTVNIVGGGTVDQVPSPPYYVGDNTVVTVTANPTTGWSFSGWSGDLTGTGNPETITMDGNKSVTATFELIRNYEPCYGLTLTVSPVGGGTATDETGAACYEEGDIVAIRALAAACYGFVNWTAPAGVFADAYAAETGFTMPGRDVTVTANFEFKSVGNPTRELPDELLPGERFAVTVTFAAPADGFHAIALTDVAPAGWEVNVNVAWADPEATAVHTPAAETAAYVWYGPYDVCVPFTAVYEVRVPVNAEPGTYTFSGSLKYYIEPHPAPPYEQGVVGDMQVRVKAGETVKIAGVTKEIDGAILPGAAVVLYQNGEAIGNVVTDESGDYEFEFSDLGDYEVVVSKAGFRGEAQSVSVTTLAIYALDFVGDHGLIPDAPSISYVLACISLWKFGEPPLQLSTFRVLDVISAWTYPIT